jgi:hypothetical protein
MIDKQYERQALFRRFRLFAFGLLMGCVIVYFMLWRGKNLTGWTPNNRVLEAVRLSEITYTKKAECLRSCLNVTETELTALFDNKGSVDFSNSEVHGVCPIYLINGIDGNDLKVKLSWCSADSTTTILELGRQQTKACPGCDSLP